MGLKSMASKIKKESKTVGYEEAFVSAIQDYVVSRPNNRSHRVAFNPSGYYKCTRQQWYKFKGAPEVKSKPTPRSAIALEIGTLTHEWIQEKILMQEDSPITLIPKEELPCWGQPGIEFPKNEHAPDMEIKFLDTRFTKEIPISGMVDGAFTFKDRDCIFEFKTINPKDYEYLSEPLSDHKKQGAIYSLCLGIPNVLFVYFDKGNHGFKAFTQTYSEEAMDWVKDRIQTVEQHYIDNTLPEKEESSDNCRWCPYKKLCQEDSIEF